MIFEKYRSTYTGNVSKCYLNWRSFKRRVNIPVLILTDENRPLCCHTKTVYSSALIFVDRLMIDIVFYLMLDSIDPSQYELPSVNENKYGVNNSLPRENITVEKKTDKTVQPMISDQTCIYYYHHCVDIVLLWFVRTARRRLDVRDYLYGTRAEQRTRISCNRRTETRKIDKHKRRRFDWRIKWSVGLHE